MLRWLSVIGVMLVLAAEMAVADNNTLVLGVMSSAENEYIGGKAEDHVENIASTMTDVGISSGRVHTAESLPGMLAALQRSDVDWFSGELFHALVLSTKINSDIFIHNRDKEVEKFHSVFFMRKASNVKNIDELDRKIVIFNNKYATAEYFVPYYALFEKNYNLSKYGAKDGKERKISDKKRVYYLFDSSRKSMIKKVLLSDKHVGVMDNHEYEKLSILVRKKCR